MENSADGIAGGTFMRRKKFSKRQRELLFSQHRARCCLCGERINDHRWIREHVKPLWLGGADHESNMGPAHISCAREKTRSESTVRAKMIRQRKKHLGLRKPQRRPMMGTVASGWRRRFDGTVERR